MMDHYQSSLQQQAGTSLNLAMNPSALNAINAQSIDHSEVAEQHMLNLTQQQQQQQQPPIRYMNQHDKVMMYQLNQYYLAKATARSKTITKTIQEVVKIVHDVLRELEIQEPRFISTFTEVNGHFEGMSLTINDLRL